MESLEKIVRELDARAQIHQVLMRNARGVDRLDRDMMISCYHPDAIDRHGVFEGSPPDFADWVISRHTGNILSSVHHLGNEYVEIDGDTAVGETYVVTHYRFDKDGKPYDMVAAGRYLDRFEKRDGQWKIAERLLILEKDRLDPVEEISTGPFTELPVKARRDKDDASFRLFPSA